MATRLAALWLRAAAHRETLREARLAQREMLLWARGRRDAMILEWSAAPIVAAAEGTHDEIRSYGRRNGRPHQPALALAEILQECDHEVFFAGTPQGVEARLVGQTDIPFVAFEASGFDRERPPYARHLFAKNFALGPQGEGVDVRSSTRCRCRLWGYVSIPVGMAAEQLNVPVVVHEQNSVMGMANKFLGKKAAAVALTYEVAGKDIADASKLIVTGNPVRSSVLSATREQGQEMLGIPQDATMLLVFGGSLGARTSTPLSRRRSKSSQRRLTDCMWCISRAEGIRGDV